MNDALGYKHKPIEDHDTRNTIPEYQQARIHDSKKGILLCPKCLVNQMENRS